MHNSTKTAARRDCWTGLAATSRARSRSSRRSWGRRNGCTRWRLC